ncbi:MAG: hypothetical protein ACYS8Z_01725 [Planctomycetota bacterium]|jgi:hypothetical protein
MLRKMTTGFTAAMRLIAAENINALRSFAKDAASLLSRLCQVYKDTKLRDGKV